MLGAMNSWRPVRSFWSYLDSADINSQRWTRARMGYQGAVIYSGCDCVCVCACVLRAGVFVPETDRRHGDAATVQAWRVHPKRQEHTWTTPRVRHYSGPALMHLFLTRTYIPGVTVLRIPSKPLIPVSLVFLLLGATPARSARKMTI